MADVGSTKRASEQTSNLLLSCKWHTDSEIHARKGAERERERGVEGEVTKKGGKEELAVMARCFFPSFARPGNGDREPSLPSYPEKEPFILPWPPGSAVDRMSGFYGPSPSSSSSSSVAFGGSAEAQAATTSKIHSLAERRRRERINSHLSTLRHMIPDAEKMDKASLLWSVIQEVKVLKRKAVDVGKRFTVPAEVNQVSVECDQLGNEPAGGTARSCPLIKVSICCDDRPDLLADIIEALHCLRLRAVRADMASLGGRVRHAFLLSRAAGEEGACLSSLVESTRDVLGKVASMEGVDSSGLSAKRRRLFHTHYSYVPY